MGISESVFQERPLAAKPSDEDVRAQLAKILASRAFSRSARMCRFLQIAVEHALSGSAEPLKEYRVGVEVFDRKADYDPRVDPIVRVEARRLRSKLKTYYSSPGKTDAILIEFPKGAYLPVFRLRTTARAGAKKDTHSSIAVLPFANLSPGAEEDYFSDGLAEELNLLLTRVQGLRVVAWHSAAKMRGQEQDLAEIRNRLKVNFVLKGAVRRTEDQVRVTAQLVNTSSGAVLWSDAYSRQMSGVVALEEQIARTIVDTLRVALGGEKPSSEIRGVPNLECYNLCLQGRFFANKRTPDGLRKSAQCYAEAIEKDEQCAVAYAGLADAFTLLADYGLENPQDTIPKAEHAARRALDLEPESADALATLAFIGSIYHWRWDEGEQLYRRAIARNPSNSKARHWFAIDHLALHGRFDEAFAEIQTARMLDPLSMIVHEGHAYLHTLKRDYTGAVAALEQMIAMDPSFGKTYATMGRAYSLAGRYDEALASMEKARKIAGESPGLIAAIGQTRALAGDRTAARQALESLEKLAATRYVPSTCFGILHLGLGETDQCLDWLERSAERHEFQVGSFKMHPLYDPVRAEDRFRKILAKAGFLP